MPVYQDIDIYGREEKQSYPVEYIDNDAIRNAFEMWLYSKPGDFIRNPGAGGPLNGITFKQMNTDTIQKFIFRLQKNVINFFVPAITLVDINFTPDYVNRILEIEISFRITSSGSVQKVKVYTNTSFAYQKLDYEDVQFSGENLLSFVQLKKSDQYDKKLIYDTEAEIWLWGKYKFVNLSISDPYFSQILALCNT